MDNPWIQGKLDVSAWWFQPVPNIVRIILLRLENVGNHSSINAIFADWNNVSSPRA